ncbi:LysE family translocator [Flammeovirga kamogawensis]|uniref:LysE family translocator n=1 Tax=Flammeovirga kamogawensis TaxID=373891 RepID=A0ABX8GQV1_9BACT|nr:LysE family translocator [Flammeovirga kamogawensis]MBB6463213.1 threonine/homoserine/homoserine lactone efflux protein [Flammeovirga kamogawensis]QWG05935.1 LysE family translocator [Flammeovirga kamogawensis]TRX67760.1 LysE family translocator [Flammeovirga kamogawensis]
MQDIIHLDVFVVTALIFVMTPGIDTIFVLNKAISEGKTIGVYSTLGINVGVMVHTFLAAMGLSIIITQSAIAFQLIKYCGAAYLFYLGISSLVNKKELNIDLGKGKEQKSNKEHFFNGVVTNVLNPKVALFFLSFFPQFIKEEAIGNALPFLILGSVYAFIGVVWFLIITYFSTLFSRKLRSNKKFNTYLNKCSGIVFLMMGIKVLFKNK